MNFEERMVQESEAAAVLNDEPTLAAQETGKGKFLPTAVTVEPEYTEAGDTDYKIAVPFNRVTIPRPDVRTFETFEFKLERKRS